jgi:hypothetical protein
VGRGSPHKRTKNYFNLGLFSLRTSNPGRVLDFEFTLLSARGSYSLATAIGDYTGLTGLPGLTSAHCSQWAFFYSGIGLNKIDNFLQRCVRPPLTPAHRQHLPGRLYLKRIHRERLQLG